MNVKQLLLVMCLLMFFGGTSARADGLGYNLVDLGYESFNDPSSSGITSDHAYTVDGSYALTKSFIVGGAYQHETANLPLGDYSANGYSAGVGYRIPLTDRVDLFPQLSYDSVNASATQAGVNASRTDTGYDLSVELRGLVTDKVELDGGFDHSSVGSATNNLFVTGLYSFTNNVAVGLSYSDAQSNGSTITGWAVALRYYFR